MCKKKKVKLVAKPAHPSLITILVWKPASWHASEEGEQSKVTRPWTGEGSEREFYSVTVS